MLMVLLFGRLQDSKMILITDIIKAINSGATALEANTLLIQHCTDFNKISLDQVLETKLEVVKRYYHHKMELDTVYDSLSFQADEFSRTTVIQPRSTKALQAKLENDINWRGLIVSCTKDGNDQDIPKSFTFDEMLEFSDLVVADVEGYFIVRKTHCNNIESLDDVDDVLNYDFSEA